MRRTGLVCLGVIGLLLSGCLVACDGDGDAGDGAADTGATGGGDVVTAGGDTAAADGTTSDGAGDEDVANGVPLVYEDRVLNIAHRGGGLLAPENTLAAYERAIEEGADMLEMDVHATRDGVLVISHDDSVDRCTDGVGRIKDMTFEEVRALDAGYDFTPDGGETYPWRGQGLVIPTLEEVLTQFPDVWMTIEPKQNEPPIVDDLMATIEDAGALDHVVIGAIEGAKLQRVREHYPEVLTGFGTEELIQLVMLKQADLETYEPPGDVIQAPLAGTDAELVERAHQFGVRLHVWTVNDRTEMQDMLDLGVDGIMSDDPRTLEGLLVERGAN